MKRIAKVVLLANGLCVPDAAAAPFAYITAVTPDSKSVVLVFDTATNSVSASLLAPALAAPDEAYFTANLAFTRDGKRGYASVLHTTVCTFPDACGAGTVHAFNPATRSFGPPIRLRGTQARAGWTALSPDGRYAYVAEIGNCYTPRAIYVVNTATDTIDGEPILVPGSQRCNQGLHSVTPDGRFLVVKTWADGTYVADTATRALAGAPIPPYGYGYYDIAPQISPDGKRIYDIGPAGIRVTDLATRAQIAVFAPPRATAPNRTEFSSAMALSPDGRLIHTLTAESGPAGYVSGSVRLQTLDAATGTPAAAPIALGDTFVWGIVLTPDGTRAYLVSPQTTPTPVLPEGSPGKTLIPVDLLVRSASPTLTLNHYDNAIPFTIANGPTTAATAFPRTPVLDNFTRADGALGASWSAATGYRIAAQRADMDAGGRAYWQAQSFGVNQEAYMRLTSIDADSQTQGLTLKAQGPSATAQPDIAYGAIEVRYSATAGAVYVITYLPRAAGGVIYAAITQRFANGDQLGARVRANGAVEVYRNGTLIGTRTMNSADQAFFNHNGGRIGLRFNTTAEQAIVDDFGGGNVP